MAWAGHAFRETALNMVRLLQFTVDVVVRQLLTAANNDRTVLPVRQ
jgi:hypothetical protein